MKTVYLDHTATTPVDPAALEAMAPYFSEVFGNPSSIHRFGREARSALERARETIAAAIGARAGEVYFTSGGTESDNLAIVGAARAGWKKGRRKVVTGAAEHHAVLDTCESLRGQGWEVTVLPVDGWGGVDPDEVGRAAAGASVVSVMHANNEVGTISPVAVVAEAAHAAGALVHTDAVQTLGRLPLDVGTLGVDLMTLSAHKIYGPKGIGALYIKTGAEVEPIFHGGGQERARRPGTENVAMAVGFAKAVEIALSEREKEMPRLGSLRDRLEHEILGTFPGAVVVNGHPAERLAHILNISFDAAKLPLEGEMLVPGLDLHGVAVTSGSACTSGSMQPSHVLLAMGRDPATAGATIRFSFGRANSPGDIQEVLTALRIVVEGARAG